ncbi:MAG: hypothetical protein U0802_26545 [Candidatus Binatia bacterium]
MTRRMALPLLALVVLAVTVATPRRAAATDNLVYIIPAAVGGVVAVVAIVAILVADRSEPEYELAPLPKAHPQSGIHFAPSCAPGATGVPLLCW